MHALVFGFTFKYVINTEPSAFYSIHASHFKMMGLSTSLLLSTPSEVNLSLYCYWNRTHTNSKNWNQQICEWTKNKALDFNHLTGKKPKQTTTKHQCWGHKSQVFPAFGDDNWVLVLGETWAVTGFCPLQDFDERQTKCVGHSARHEEGWKGVHLLTGTRTILLNVAVTSSVCSILIENTPGQKSPCCTSNSYSKHRSAKTVTLKTRL